MMTSAKTMAAATLELISNENLLKQVRDEFKERTRGFTYDPLIPEGQKPNPLGMR